MRTDLVIATLALLISAGATVSSLYQTHVIADQLSSSVWPYLDINSTTTTGRAWQLDITNDGLGPALVRSASLTVDGRPVGRYRDAFALLLRNVARATHVGKSAGSIGSSSVIRAGETFPLLSIRGPVIASLGDIEPRVVLNLCYCSLQDQCWNVASQRMRVVAVSGCGPERSIDY